MARILFAWEMGDHLGHLMAFQPLVRALLDAGHDVALYSKRVESARQVFSDGRVRIHAAPALNPPAKLACPQPDSYAEILLNTTFFDPEHAVARVKEWRAVFEQERPDVIVFDFSPAAMLANRAYDIPGIVFGNGFSAPPAASPLPPLRYWRAPDRQRLQRHEALLLDRMNACLTDERRRLDTVAELFDRARVVLRTFPELDQYPRRHGGHYVGMAPPENIGQSVRWPAAPGPRMFAYLQPSEASSAVLAALSESDLSAVVHCPGIFAAGQTPPQRDNLCYVDTHVRISEVLAECDLVATNANSGTTTNALSAGRPVLLAPNTLEKQIFARRVEALGAGLAVSRRSLGTAAVKLQALASQRSYRRSAEQFARKYGSWTPEWQTGEMLSVVNSLLGRT